MMMLMGVLTRVYSVLGRRSPKTRGWTVVDGVHWALKQNAELFAIERCFVTLHTYIEFLKMYATKVVKCKTTVNNYINTEVGDTTIK